jgi:hypothetical protein
VLRIDSPMPPMAGRDPEVLHDETPSYNVEAASTYHKLVIT